MNDISDNRSSVLSIITGRCPRCARGHLFQGVLKLAPRCEKCGLDFSFADPADGPAFFAMSIVAVPLLAFALWFQFSYDPPLWAHLLLTVPLTLISCLVLLRPLKAWLVSSQYRHGAAQGSIDREWHRLAGEKNDPE